jgi:hypothetical protein
MMSLPSCDGAMQLPHLADEASPSKMMTRWNMYGELFNALLSLVFTSGSKHDVA